MKTGPQSDTPLATASPCQVIQLWAIQEVDPDPLSIPPPPLVPPLGMAEGVMRVGGAAQ